MDDMQPPPSFCDRRDEGTRTIISARIETGLFTLLLTVFAAFWSLVVIVIAVSVVSKIMSGAPLMKEVNGVMRASSPAEYLLMLAAFVAVALALDFAAIFANRGRVSFDVDHDSVRLFVGTLGIGRRVRIARASIRGVSLVAPRRRRDSTTHGDMTSGPEHISLDGTDISTGAALAPASRAWLARELRQALGLRATVPATTEERDTRLKGK